jgi:hypothetical protein
MVVNDNAGNLVPPRRSQVYREQARSYRKWSARTSCECYLQVCRHSLQPPAV